MSMDMSPQCLVFGQLLNVNLIEACLLSKEAFQVLLRGWIRTPLLILITDLEELWCDEHLLLMLMLDR